MERKWCRAEAAEAPGLLRSARTQCSGRMAAGAQACLPMGAAANCVSACEHTEA